MSCVRPISRPWRDRLLNSTRIGDWTGVPPITGRPSVGFRMAAGTSVKPFWRALSSFNASPNPPPTPAPRLPPSPSGFSDRVAWAITPGETTEITRNLPLFSRQGMIRGAKGFFG